MDLNAGTVSQYDNSKLIRTFTLDFILKQLK